MSQREEAKKLCTDIIVMDTKPHYQAPDFIVDNVYLGSVDSATYLEELQKLKITHVMVVGTGLKLHFPDHIKYQ